MNPEQIPELIARIALADKRIRVEDPVEQTAQIEMWAGILADVPYEFALKAAHAHYAEKVWPILPADIATRWRAVVRDRMDRHTGTLEPTRHPELDPDDAEGFVRTLRAERHAVIMGQAEPTPLKAITGADAIPADVQARLDAIGQYIPDHARQALAAYRPQKAERERLIRQGQPDPLSVPCPWCDAATDQPCRGRRITPGRDPESKRQGGRAPHPSRLDAARTRTNAA